MTHLEFIERSLLGKFYWRFAVASSFDLSFEDFVLSTQEMVSPDEAFVCDNSRLETYARSRETANPELVVKSAVISTCLGVPIAAVDVLSDSSLQLTFDNGVAMRLPTDTPIVDWHWAITDSGGDPYVSCHVACFAPGEIRGRMPNASS